MAATDSVATGSVTVLLDSNSASSAWPVIGEQTLAARRPPGSGDAIVEEAVRIMRRCAGPLAGPASTLGLVVGYVQSGKTASFTTVCALARDNQFPLVIVIGGTSLPLFEQSKRRLERDLNLVGTTTQRQWLYVPYTMKGPSPASPIGAALEDWRDATIEPWRRRTVLLAVMKHHGHLRALVSMLGRLDLGGVRAIVVDDEGDQAGLNTLVNRNDESATYRQIQALRRSLPVHSYLLYTATPQAPLLISIIDTLSPSFAEVLTPGASYTGGAVFFAPGSRYVQTIPGAEIPAKGVTPSHAPASFLDALATFWVGLAAGVLQDKEVGNRSMLVHPHQTRAKHNEFFTWALALKENWALELNAVGDEEFRASIVSRFHRAHGDLAQTDPNLPGFDEILLELPKSIRRTSVLEVNSTLGQTPSVQWEHGYGHILVGGQAMDRGFTVEGLTVTYMPRGLGDGNADTIQQRARFFGYKRSYLGLCRVWLEASVRSAFEEYVEHEEVMRKELLKHRETGRHLREWRRAFFLDPSLRPTRRQVVNVPYLRDNHQGRWVGPKRSHDDADAVAANKEQVKVLVAALPWTEQSPHADRTEHTRHKITDGVSLKWIYETFLVHLHYPDVEDTAAHTALLLEIDSFLDEVVGGHRIHANATCMVVQMGPEGSPRNRQLEDGELQKLFQGANPSTGPNQGSKYPGDAAIRDATDLTVQLHRVALRDARQALPAPLDDMYIVSVYVPDKIGKSWLVQSQ